MEVIVIQSGTLEHKGKPYPWRVLQNGAMEIYEDEKEEWNEFMSLDEVIK